jgi:hypothetical protein
MRMTNNSQKIDLYSVKISKLFFSIVILFNTSGPKKCNPISWIFNKNIALAFLQPSGLV